VQMSRPVALLAALVLPGRALAADLVFVGNLRLVTPEFVTVRLDDGRVIDAKFPKTGDLTAATMTDQYKLADRVQITCKRIQSVHDKVEDRYHVLELQKLQLLRPPLPEEVAKVVASLSWQGGDNLLKPSAVAAQPAEKLPDAAPGDLEHVRTVNLDRADKLPSFVADEMATRSRGHTGSTKWRLVDTIESEITFQGSNATRRHVRINGKPWGDKQGSSPSAWLPGINWGLGFGLEIAPLLARDCSNTFELAAREELRGRQLAVYKFRSPQDGCFGAYTMGYQQYEPARTGRILVDDAGGNVIQMEYETIGGPAEFSGSDKAVLSWDFVKIGDAFYLLPVAAEYVFTFSSGDMWHIVVQYKNHRHFEASANVTFH
jgi:hypothetical protein